MIRSFTRYQAYSFVLQVIPGILFFPLSFFTSFLIVWEKQIFVKRMEMKKKNDISQEPCAVFSSLKI